MAYCGRLMDTVHFAPSVCIQANNGILAERCDSGCDSNMQFEDKDSRICNVTCDNRKYGTEVKLTAS